VADSPPGEVAQKDAVVASDLDHEWVFPLEMLRVHGFREFPEMLGHPDGGGGVEGVTGMEHPIPVHQVHQLHRGADGTERDAQFEEIFLRELLRQKEAVRDRHLSERKERTDPGSAYEAITHPVIPASARVPTAVRTGSRSPECSTYPRPEK